MLIVLSPAKRLDFETPPHVTAHSQPRFLTQARTLVGLLKKLDARELASLMSISDPLAALNVARYGQWKPPFTPRNARPALLAFAGDVYEGLDAASLDEADLAWAQDRVRILSGLYGVLRPLDLIQPYRLEMGTRLENPKGRDLYAYWGQRLAQAIDEELATHASPILVNLASAEYFRALGGLRARVVQPVFQERRADGWKVMAFAAKRARGAMTRYAVEERIDDPRRLQGFDVDGYRFEPAASSETSWVFRRG